MPAVAQTGMLILMSVFMPLLVLPAPAMAPVVFAHRAAITSCWLANFEIHSERTNR
jgi:hypothetical protein